MCRLYTSLREPVNSLTHWLGVILAVPFMAVMLWWAERHELSLWPFVIFGVSFALLYLASASYHSFQVSERALLWLRKLDHSAIFLLIAGSYTPIAYFGLGDPLRWTLLAVIWGIALAGMTLKLITMRMPRWLSTVLYLAMGWLALAFLPALAQTLPTGAFIWMGVGGALYTLGAIVYATKKLNFVPGVFGFHEVWHLFVLGGSTAHFAMMLNLR
ncbi:PAQR family membrane homeostasis protein TrhA [Deinococcus peraridilitoris]|uniref:Channel protein, hemolysin III family n=1 Tax=Deinococcus peraridilitoris (strain DSM 19664 / LMG 22246 / CIP 109416 / KR-200) TaxID=937777 RepID=K9ZXK6_DEIPD|nr:hemolysin III family protein [Deinococcus peraridilitoris]AFZ65934.1 channel protein, hemolysin III family [Deinococcus peraridilitoris DSM 19664]